TQRMPPTSLKQRLAALSISPSSSSSSSSNGQEPSGPRSPFSALKRKTQAFNPPWAKRPQHEGAGASSPIQNTMGMGSGALQEVMARMIFQAGVDFECVFIFLG
ncbi:hypothetical protein H0H92_012237, partial [Tricholoma furcatifolium]